MPNSGAKATTDAMLTIAPAPCLTKRGVTAAASRVSAVALRLISLPTASGLVRCQARLHLRELPGFGEIRVQQIDGDAGLGAQARSQGFQPSQVARHEHQVVAPLCEAIRIDRADSSGGTRD
jgi:hypothetical protein